MGSAREPDTAMEDLFRRELGEQTGLIEESVALLKDPATHQKALSALLKAAHSLKGAALLMHVGPVVELAQAIERLVDNTQQSQVVVPPEQLQALSDSVVTLRALATESSHPVLELVVRNTQQIEQLIAALLAKKQKERSVKPSASSVVDPKPTSPTTDAASAFDPAMLGLFFVDLDTQTHQLSEGLLSLEANPNDVEALAALMRAAHSIKGAARVLGLADLVELARAIEELLFAFRDHPGAIEESATDLLLVGVDLLQSLASTTPEEISRWLVEKKQMLQETTRALQERIHAVESPAQHDVAISAPAAETPLAKETALRRLQEARLTRVSQRDRVLRLNADYLTRLMGLAGELLVESRWLQPFADELLQLKKAQYDLSAIVDILRSSYDDKLFGDEGQQNLLELQRKTNQCRQSLAERLDDLELFIRRHGTLSDRLYREVISSRLCPFGEGVEDLPRMVRDLARQLHKKVLFEIIGRSTTIDRDILDKLQAPLHHLLRNAVDHGIELPEERIAAGKKPEGVIRLEARHRAGVLGITVSDDGRGINLERLRAKIVEKKLVDATMAQQLTDAELLDFLFLPGFTTASKVTDISGRGIGLNVVQSMVHDVGGQVRVYSTDGKGMTFHLQLPLTLSVLRALLVEIAGEPYAFPLARIERAVVLERNSLQVIERRQYVRLDDQNIGLIPGHQILGFPPTPEHGNEISVVVLSDNFNSYGVVVDRLLGERELVVQEIDPRIGKISDISCGALMEDGSPVLVVDVEDMVRSMDNLLSAGYLEGVDSGDHEERPEQRKRILVVDDSITVREVECRILENEGYEVDVAVNGVDGWNSVRIEDYDLVVTDVDMPRMNGIELVRLIKNDLRLKRLPVMIVSYKERGEDRKMGMDAGADFYLAKSSFHDDSFLQAVKDLLGDDA